ncbi:Na(+)/H(+) antiporter subunit C [Marisediminicola sp. LYQ134]|uniref:Na(+)/H(+) antiporter subunit C n=1 Tax=unclassified Marisediminicola TaxID=2618316 RepID=UPI0039836C4A
MSLSLTLVIVMAIMYACAVYLILERSLTRVLLGFLLAGNATNLLILIMAGEAGMAPIVGGGVEPGEMSDPLPQALILTAIVITFAVSAFLMALIYRSWRLAREDELLDDADDVAMRSGEPSVVDDRIDIEGDDTEFGVRARAAISTARDLEERDELAARIAASTDRASDDAAAADASTATDHDEDRTS